MSNIPLLEAKDLAELRRQEKTTRFCPACGYRRLTSQALHHRCEVCQYEFVLVAAAAVQEVRTDSQTGKEATFGVIGLVTVPIGREGVRKLIDELCGNTGSYPKDKPTGRFSDI